jgi:hypothetical protein
MSAARYPADCRRHGHVHGRRRLCPGDVRREHHRQRHRDYLSGRTAARESRDRRGGHQRGARRGRPSHAPVGGQRPLGRKTISTRLNSVVPQSPHWDARPPKLRRERIEEPLYPGRRPLWNYSPGIPVRPGTFARSLHASWTGAAGMNSRRVMDRRWSAASPHWMGHLIGIVANNGVLLPESSLKGRAFRPTLFAAPDSPCCFSRTSPGSWSARSTKAEASSRTGPRWCRRWRPADVPQIDPRRRGLPRGRQLRHVRPGVRGRDSSLPGPTPGSRSWARNRPARSWSR